MPEAALLDTLVGDLPQAGGRQALDAVEQAVAGIAALPGQPQGHLAAVDVARKTVAGEDRLVLRGEQDSLRRVGHRHRLDSKTVTRKPQRTAASVEIGEGKHPVEQRHGFFGTPVMQGFENHFGIADGSKDDALRLQRFAQRAVIVDLAIVDESAIAGRSQHRLTGGGRGIDDGKSAVTERQPIVVPAVMIVGAAMYQRLHHAGDIRQVVGVDRVSFAPDAGYSAHGLPVSSA
ncbi:hypothetical protein [Mesorhizobium sp. LSHC440A00]|nr:hypothetical protein [Mesorhizobium sp. LSHC440A00]ESX44932.1 hypothetical protein X764_03205 [Mesorhizobium sp. LSHC440A00]